MIRTRARVVYHSSKHLPRIQMEFSVKEAELILSGHKNVTNVLLGDLQRAVAFANQNKPGRETQAPALNPSQGDK